MDDPANDPKLQNYQDDIDTEGVDRVTHEATDDPSKELQVPPERLGEELDKLDGDAGEGEDRLFVEEDMREQIEDLDEDGERKN